MTKVTGALLPIAIIWYVVAQLDFVLGIFAERLDHNEQALFAWFRHRAQEITDITGRAVAQYSLLFP